MEIFFIALAGNLEHCILDKNPYNYEVSLKITYDDFRLSILKKKSVLDVTEEKKYEQKDVGGIKEENVKKEESRIKEDGTHEFWGVGEEEMKCFENVVRQRLADRNSEVTLGVHRITYFYSDSLMAMPDYLYDTSVSSFPLLIGVDVEKMLMIR